MQDCATRRMEHAFHYGYRGEFSSRHARVCTSSTHSQQRFRFKTRLQRLNSIEASSRAKVNFLEQLYRYHKQQGNSRVTVPTINHKPLDLWLLRKEVQKQGGYEAVCHSSIFRVALS